MFDEEDIAQFAENWDQFIYGIKKGEEIMKKDYRDVIRVWNDGTSIPYDYDEIMDSLKHKGIISGWEVGDYI